MAVTKIRKISSWTLLITSIITVVVLGIFYFGGVVDPTSDPKEPIYTDLLLYWGYIIFALATICTLGFALLQFASSLKEDPKGAIVGVGAIVSFFVLLVITYSIGNDTPLSLINDDSAKFNTSGWLKITDMWLYSTYVLIGLIILAVIAGSVRRIMNR